MTALTQSGHPIDQKNDVINGQKRPFKDKKNRTLVSYSLTTSISGIR